MPKIVNKFGVIYKITNKINNKVYIGQTKRSVEERWAAHKYSVKKTPNYPLSRAIIKYGSDNFIMSIIDFAEDKQSLNDKEIAWIFHYNSTEIGYNLTPGGEGHTGIVFSPDALKRIGDASRGRKWTPETIQKRTNSILGRKVSDDVKHKMSLASPKNISIICITTGIVYHSINYAGKCLGIDEESVRQCITGKRKTAGGFQFKKVI